MIRYKTDCPCCGNEINVNDSRKKQKCHWCKSLIIVNLERKGKKIKCEVEPAD